MYYAQEKVCNEGHKFIDGYFWIVEFLGVFFVCLFINTSFNQVAQRGLEPIVLMPQPGITVLVLQVCNTIAG